MRLIAWSILIVPGVIAGIGIKWMRDTFFDQLAGYFPYLWIQFIAGLFAFVFGLTFIGGFVLHRERKKKNTKNKCQKSSSN